MTCQWPGLLAAGNLLENTQLLWATVALVGTLLVGALILAWTNRWRKNYTKVAMSAGEQMAEFREAFERGELSEEEFKRIRQQLTPGFRKEINAKPGSPPYEGGAKAGRMDTKPSANLAGPPPDQRPAPGPADQD